MASSSPAARRSRAAESFKSAAEALGDLGPGSSVFALTRGQWSMIDAIGHILDLHGPAGVSIWTWTTAHYDVSCLDAFREDGRITDGRLIIAKRGQHADVIREWRRRFGPESVRYVMSHAKIARVHTTSGLRFLLRGSGNLNHSPKFEQFDLTEGGLEFDLVRGVEDELPILPASATDAEVYAASGVGEAWPAGTLDRLGGGLRTWG